MVYKHAISNGRSGGNVNLTAADESDVAAESAAG